MPPTSIDKLKQQAQAAALKRAVAQDKLAASLADRKAKVLMAAGGGGGFDAARRDRFRGKPRPRGGSADSHRDPVTIDALRRDCAELVRNDADARSLVARCKDAFAGPASGAGTGGGGGSGGAVGVRMRVRSSDPAFNKDAERWIAEVDERRGFDASRRRTLGGFCRAYIHSCAVAGGMLLIKTTEGLQLVELERVMNPSGKTGGGSIGGPYGFNVQAGENGNGFANGFEVDRVGRIVAAHVAEWESGYAGGGTRPKMTTRAVGAEFLLPCFAPMDGGDEGNVTVPEPLLTPLIETFDALKKYDKAVLIASQMGAIFGLLTKTAAPEATQDGFSVVETTAGSAAGYDSGPSVNREIVLAPGMVDHLLPGEDVVQVKPEQPTTVYEQYMLAKLTRVGAACGFPLALWLLDGRQVNFHSMRSVVALAYALTGAVWRGGMKSDFLHAGVRFVLGMAVRGWMGGIPRRDEAGNVVGVWTAADVPADWGRVDAIFPPMPLLDPAAQWAAEKLAVDAGFRTIADVVMQTQGKELDEHLDELQSERDKMREMGIVVATMPGAGDLMGDGAGSGDGKKPTGGDGGGGDE